MDAEFSRPYRSHKVRACDLCRRRKARCSFEGPGQACRLCQAQGIRCQYLEGYPSSPRRSSARQTRKRQQSPSQSNGLCSSSVSIDGRTSSESTLPVSGQVTDGESASLDSRSSVAIPRTRNARTSRNDSPALTSSHIVGPATAHDMHLLEEYMSPGPAADSSNMSIFSADPKKPVLFTATSRHRPGHSASLPSGDSQREIMSQILGSAAPVLAKLSVKIQHDWRSYETDEWLGTSKNIIHVFRSWMTA
jgi:hypothetical protein